MIQFDPFPTIETDRLILRQMEPRDSADLFEIRSDARMHEYTDTQPDEHISATRAYIERMNHGVEAGRWIVWAIEHKLSGKVVGTIGIWNFDAKRVSGELGFVLSPDYQRQGLMIEAIHSVADFSFHDLELQQLLAYTEEKNFASIRLLSLCKFVEIDRLEEAGAINPQVQRMIVFRLENV